MIAALGQAVVTLKFCKTYPFCQQMPLTILWFP